MSSFANDAPTSKAPNDLEYAVANTPNHPAPSVPVVQGVDVSTSDQGVVVGHWDAGLWSCFDHLVPNCLMVYFCPCVSIAQIVHRLNMFPYQKALMVVAGLWVANVLFSMLASTFNTRSYTCTTDSLYAVSCHWEGTSLTFFYWLSTACSLAAVFLVFQLRGRFRARFEIPGSQVEDCLLGFFCSCCAVAQMATHCKSYEPGVINFRPPDQLPAFK